MRYNKKQEKEIIDNYNLSKLEIMVFEGINKGTKREQLSKELNRSIPTIDRTIRKIKNKIEECEIEMKDSYKIYSHIFPNGKKYVGICINPEERWNNGLGYAYNKLMYDDILKYGWENIEHKILCEFKNREEALRLERNLIDTFNLYNIEYGYNGR